MNTNRKCIYIWVTMVFALALVQGCTSSTSSTSSGASSISRIQVIPAASSMQASQQNTNTTTGTTTYIWSTNIITVIVRDNNGNLAPAGTSVIITCGAGFLGDNPDPANPVSSLTATTDSNGQVQVRYTAGFSTGTTASISATSMGNSGSTTISITT